jgi:glyoxylase-like metal-dependent hydrolase (beta-lactamase superfamily II)
MRIIILTVLQILSIGGLKAIIISHPHYYASMNEWLTAFNCPVYAAPEDREWLKNTPAENKVTFLHEEVTEILPGVTALKVGGHFPGSFLLHWDKLLFHGDTFITNWVSFRSPYSNM